MKENNKIKYINKIIFGTIMGVASISAAAQTNAVVKDDSLVTSKKPLNNQSIERIFIPGKVTHIGTVSDNPVYHKKLKGFASDLPLITVMKQITPNGWVVKKSDSEDNPLNVQKNISWEGGKTWIEILEDIAYNYNLNFLINWRDKTVTISNSTTVISNNLNNKEKDFSKTPKTSKKAIFQLAGTEETEINTKSDSKLTKTGKSEQKLTKAEKLEQAIQLIKQLVEQEQPVQQEQPAKIEWDLDPSKTLKENVIAWGEKAGYRVVWNGEDYSVIDKRTLTGEFDSDNGPIKQLAIDYGPESRVQIPLSFQFYQNRILVVENITFEQSGYPQFSKR